MFRREQACPGESSFAGRWRHFRANISQMDKEKQWLRAY
jgi:hypothetical protein